jgi:hypothetical protein
MVPVRTPSRDLTTTVQVLAGSAASLIGPRMKCSLAAAVVATQLINPAKTES